MAFFLVLLSSIFFYLSLDFLSTFRASHTYLTFFVPLLVLLLVFERRISRFRLSSREEVKNLMSPSRPRASIYAGVFLMVQSLVVHFFGGSVGREGIGIQLGAWSARWANAPRWYRAGCIATGITVILGAPITATAFLFESALMQKKKFNWLEVIAVPVMATGADLLIKGIGIKHFSFPRFGVSALGQLADAKSMAIVVGLILLVTLLSAIFLQILARTAAMVSIATDRSLLFGAGGFLGFFTFVAFFFGEMAGLTGLGSQVWPSLYGSETAALEIGPQLLLLAILKVAFTAGFSGLGFKGGEVTPMLVVGTFCGVYLATVSVPILAVIAFSTVWGVTARRPFVAAALGYEYFGGAAIAAGLVTFLSLKLGDAIFKSRFIKNEKVRNAWQCGLYD